MQLRHTIFLSSKEDNSVCRIEIYTVEKVQAPGFWNVETNHVLLSFEAYSHFKDLHSQNQQKIFFDSLKKVSSLVIAGTSDV